jgi:tripeptide aminopeptidase
MNIKDKSILPVVKVFKKLVQIDSPSGKEGTMCRYLINWAKQNNLYFRVDKIGNLLIKTFKDKPKTEPFLLCAHMDTVEPGCGIKPMIENGIIKSSGNTVLGADNKSTLAAMIVAYEELKEAGIQLSPLEFLFTVKEESGGGVEFFNVDWLSSKKGLICDSSNPLGGIVLRSPYLYNFHVTIEGKAVHASMPDKGVNALESAVQILEKIPVGLLDSGDTTINVGLISGGSGINTVPELVQFSGEVRSYDQDRFESWLNKIERIVNEKNNSKQGLKVKFYKDGYLPGYSFSKSDDYVKFLTDIFDKTRHPVEYYLYSGGSDGNVLNDKGLKVVNVTDATKYTHTVNEQIKVKDLEELKNFIKEVLTYIYK